MSKEKFNEKIDSNKTISDDPFDVLSCKLYKTVVKKGEEKIVKKAMINDDLFKNLLTKSKTKTEVTVKEKAYGIFFKMNVLSQNEIDLFTQDAYKFPFNMEIRNDGSSLFKMINSEFQVALNSVFKKYKSDGDEFFVKFGDNFLHFSKKLKVTCGIKKLLINNDIEFKEEGSFILVEDVDISLVFDLVINTNILNGHSIPFILSYTPFVNSIFYKISLEKGTTVRDNGNILFSYTLVGPFWANNYKNLMDKEYNVL